MITEGEAEAEILCVSWIGGLVTHFNPLRFHHLEGTGDKLTWQRKYFPIYSWKSPGPHTVMCGRLFVAVLWNHGIPPLLHLYLLSIRRQGGNSDHLSQMLQLRFH